MVLAPGFGLLMRLRTAVMAMRGWMFIALDASLKAQRPPNLFGHLVNLPASYFEARHLGDVVSRFGSQQTILQAVAIDVVEAILDRLFVAFTLVIMFLTSHLDVANEQPVSATIRALRITRIIIAHRPETIRSADRVISLDAVGGRAGPDTGKLQAIGSASPSQAGGLAQIGSA